MRSRSFNRRALGVANRPFLAAGGCFGLIIAIVIVGAIAFGAMGYWNDESVRITISSKESVTTDDHGHEYRVYTDKGTYVVKDSIVKGRFDSADEYGRLKENHTYNCQAFGFRIPVLSSFKNLHKCHEA